MRVHSNEGHVIPVSSIPPTNLVHGKPNLPGLTRRRWLFAGTMKVENWRAISGVLWLKGAQNGDLRFLVANMSAKVGPV